MKHDPSTEGIKARLAGRQHAFVSGHPGALKPRAVVAAHAGAQSVGTNAGVKPDCSGDCSGPNADANASYNDQMDHATTRAAGKLSAGQLVGSGEKLS
jgi:hypothetical protein